MLYPGEILIHDGLPDGHPAVFDPVIDGKPRARGGVPRDYAVQPRTMFAPPDQLKVYPQDQWPGLLAEQTAKLMRLSDIRQRGNFGQPIPSLDQGQVGYCLTANQLVRMEGGQYKFVQDVAAGDRVVTIDGSSGTVRQTHRRPYDGVLVSVADSDGGVLTTTADHAFAVRGEAGGVDWVRASDLKPGQGNIRPGADGTVRLVGARVVKGCDVFDIGVEGSHSFVANGFGVHNCWAHSPTQAVILVRAAANLPYVPLSAYSVAATIKKGADEGGWGGLSAQFIRERGIMPQSVWPQGNRNYKQYDTPANWEQAANYKVVQDWVDLTRDVYDQTLTFAQVATCAINNQPGPVDFNWWSHSVCLLDLVNGNGTYRHPVSGRDPVSGKLWDLKTWQICWGIDHPVTAGFGLRIWNSWGDGWSDAGSNGKGTGVLTGSKAVPDGALAFTAVTLSLAA